MLLVAEGVETSGQAAYLRQIGCHLAQGYLFAKPLSEEQLVSWYKQHRQQPLPGILVEF
ncbi:hypothetical protein C7H85_10900 [Zobellella endophytica]|uniref:EAL domain-containing protein n=1 Tax=Zobellella endophytica TaxID=2116700 RepID=A0A2P7R563_9GAMM|nr:hypothetical protein C7H85_10900 [Zobellella endophytica]